MSHHLPLVQRVSGSAGALPYPTPCGCSQVLLTECRDFFFPKAGGSPFLNRYSSTKQEEKSNIQIPVVVCRCVIVQVGRGDSVLVQPVCYVRKKSDNRDRRTNFWSGLSHLLQKCFFVTERILFLTIWLEISDYFSEIILSDAKEPHFFWVSHFTNNLFLNEFKNILHNLNYFHYGKNVKGAEKNFFIQFYKVPLFDFYVAYQLQNLY